MNLNEAIKKAHAEEAAFDKKLARWGYVLLAVFAAFIIWITYVIHENTTIKENFPDCKITSVHGFNAYGTTTALTCWTPKAEYRIVTKMQAPVVGENRSCYELNSGSVRCHE